MTYGQHLKRSRHGTLAFRFKFPPDVARVLEKSEVTTNLSSCNKREVMYPVARLRVLTLALIALIRGMTEQEKSIVSADSKTILTLLYKKRSELLEEHLAQAERQITILQAMLYGTREELRSALQNNNEELKTALDRVKTTVRTQGDHLRKIAQTFSSLSDPGSALSNADTTYPQPQLELEKIRDARRYQGLDVEGGKILISELVDRYCRSQTWKNWDDRVRRDYMPVRDLLIDVVKGDIAIELLTISHVRAFSNKVQDEGRQKGSATKTIGKKLDFLKAVLNWAQEQALLGKISQPLSFETESTSYEHFNSEELKEMFECPTYINNEFNRASAFWLPLLGLFTGARINEICSIELSHLTEVDGVFGINFSPEGKKSGKNQYSRRFVPLHPNLIEAGFLDYLNILCQENHSSLFPCLGTGGERDGKGKTGTRIFTEFRRSLGIGADEGRGTKTFHSFRSTLVSALQRSGVPAEIRRNIVGHAAVDTHESVYSQSGTPPSILLQSLEQVEYKFRMPQWHDSEAYQYARTHGRVRRSI